MLHLMTQEQLDDLMFDAANIDRYYHMLDAMDSLDSDHLSAIWYCHMHSAANSFEKPELCALFAQAMKIAQSKLEERGHKISYEIAESICAAWTDQIPALTYELELK